MLHINDASNMIVPISFTRVQNQHNQVPRLLRLDVPSVGLLRSPASSAAVLVGVLGSRIVEMLAT